MYDQSDRQLARILRNSLERGAKQGPGQFTLEWGGKQYAVREITNVQSHQEGETLSYIFRASNGVNNFKVKIRAHQ